MAEGPTLYCWLRQPESLDRFAQLLSASFPGVRVHGAGQCVVVPTGGGGARVAGLIELVDQTLPADERDGARFLLASNGVEPGLSLFPDVVPLAQLEARSKRGWLEAMLVEERTTSFFQPIVYAEDTSRVFGQEALLRGLEPDGTLVPPLRLLAVARSNDLLETLELAAQRSAVARAHQHDLRADLFINMSPSSARNTRVLLDKVSEVLRAMDIPPARVVFEITEASKLHDVEHWLQVIRTYRVAGFRVALDDLGAGYASLNLVHQLRPDILKLDMELVRDVHQDAFKALLTEKLIEAARSMGIITIAEGIESEGELDWVRRHRVPFVQGFLVARPAPAPVTCPPRL